MYTHISRYHQKKGHILTSKDPFHLIIRAQQRWPSKGLHLMSTWQSKLTRSNGVPHTGSSFTIDQVTKINCSWPLDPDMNDCSSLKQETGNHGKTWLKRLLCLSTVAPPIVKWSDFLKFLHTVISLQSCNSDHPRTHIYRFYSNCFVHKLFCLFFICFICQKITKRCKYIMRHSFMVVKWCRSGVVLKLRGKGE